MTDPVTVAEDIYYSVVMWGMSTRSESREVSVRDRGQETKKPMSPPEHELTAREALPADLVETVDELDAPALRHLSGYVNQRLRDSSEPIAEMIREEAGGEILDIDDRGTYTLVRKRPQSRDASEAGSQPVSVYHVRRKRRPDGGETLQWSFIGDIDDT